MIFETNLDGFDGDTKLTDAKVPPTSEKSAEVSASGVEGNDATEGTDVPKGVPTLPFQASSPPNPTTPIYQQKLEFSTPTIVQPSKTRKGDSGVLPT